MFAVVVTIVIRPDRMPEFLPQMEENARKSLSDEPGCHRFDICTDESRPSEVFLYELYTDRAAFDAHLASEHYKAFDSDVASLVLYKDVNMYANVAT